MLLPGTLGPRVTVQIGKGSTILGLEEHTVKNKNIRRCKNTDNMNLNEGMTIHDHPPDLETINLL